MNSSKDLDATRYGFREVLSLQNNAAEASVSFPDATILASNLVASRLRDVL